jgi:xylulokinase
MLLDIHRKDWANEILESIDLSPDKLPKLHLSTAVIGEVTDKAAKNTKLKKGTPVIVGGHDQCCACVGTGVISSGLALDSTGTASAIMCPSEKPIIDPKKRLICYCHSIPKYWVVLGQLLTAGMVVRWFRDTFCNTEMDEARRLGIDPYEVLMRKAKTIEAGSDGLIILPFFAGGRFLNTNAKGVIFGLTLNHKKPHIYRAIMEGVAYENRFLVEAIKKLGIQVKELRLAGGAAKNPLWRQIKCDVTGKPALLPRVEEAASLGAAILAGVGVGAHGNVEEAVKRAVTFKERYEPRMDFHEIYNKLYQVYQRLTDDFFKSEEAVR